SDPKRTFATRFTSDAQLIGATGFNPSARSQQAVKFAPLNAAFSRGSHAPSRLPFLSRRREQVKDSGQVDCAEVERRLDKLEGVKLTNQGTGDTIHPLGKGAFECEGPLNHLSALQARR